MNIVEDGLDNWIKTAHDKNRREYKVGEYHISDLVGFGMDPTGGWCARELFYKFKNPDSPYIRERAGWYERGRTWEDIVAEKILPELGWTIHASGPPKDDNDPRTLTMDVPYDDGSTIKLIGHIDMLVSPPNDKTVYVFECKSTQFSSRDIFERFCTEECGFPKSSHIIQAGSYGTWMAHPWIIGYLSIGDVSLRAWWGQPDKDILDIPVMRAKYIHKCLLEDTMPDGRTSWKCDFSSKMKPKIYCDAFNFCRGMGNYGPHPAIYGFCLPGDTLITTPSRDIPIKDVVAGKDNVVSFSASGARINKVLENIKTGRKTVYSVRTRNRVIRASAEHPFLVATIIDPAIRYNSRTRTIWDLTWVPVKSLRKGDYLITVWNLGKTFEEYRNVNSLTEGTAKLMGCLIGDGTIGKYTVGIALPNFGRKAGERLNYVNILKKMTKNPISEEKYRIIAHDVKLASWLKSLGLGGDAKTKRIPSWVYNLPPKLIRCFLGGLLFADGHEVGNGVSFNIELCNKRLIEDIKSLAERIGLRTSNILERDPRRSMLRSGKEINSSKTYTINIPFNTKRHTYRDGPKLLIPHEFNFERVVAIERGEIEDVYDLVIENDHNFVANGAVVHNCANKEAHGGKALKIPEFNEELGKSELLVDPETGRLVCPAPNCQKRLSRRTLTTKIAASMDIDIGDIYEPEKE